jgi:hypothetical protein
MISGSITQNRSSCDTISDLAGLPDSAFLDGEWAYVIATKQTFRLDRTSTATADNTSVVTTHSTNGRWIEFEAGDLTPFVGAGTVDTVVAAPVSLSGVRDYDNFTLDAGVTVTVPNGGYLVIRAKQSITINGTIDADGVNNAVDLTELEVRDYIGRVMGSQAGSGGGGGGGGGNGGAAGTAGTVGSAAARYGYDATTPGTAGTFGAGGAAPGSGAAGGVGGAAGAPGLESALFTVRNTLMNVLGMILPAGGALGAAGSNGGAGGAGLGVGFGAGGAAGAGGAGGAGGGAIILIAPSITLGAAAVLTAAGLDGAAGSAGGAGGAGGAAGGGGGGGGGGAGGAGGCGGLVAGYYGTFTDAGVTVNVGPGGGGVGGAAGAAGADGGVGAGGAGAAGGAGTDGSAGIVFFAQTFAA